MKRIFISDLHIGDGSAKDDFLYDEDLIDFLNDFMDENEVELVFVGDCLEITESEQVRSLGLVPFEEVVEKLDGGVLDAIEKRHTALFDVLKRFSKRHKVFYVVGNHDYHLLKNESLQKAMKERFEKLEILPFFYDERYRILALHGNQFDTLNRFSVDRKTGKVIPPLGDFISRYMMIEFDSFISSFVPDEVIKDYDNVRPLLDLFHWFEYVTEFYDLGMDLLEEWVKKFLEMLRTEEARRWIKNNFPKTHWLSRVFVNRFGGLELGRILVRTAYHLRRMRRVDYLLKWAKGILKGKERWREYMIGYEEGLERVGKVDILVMGHIHHFSYNIIPVKDGKKLYINCGSWRPVVEKIGLRRKSGFHKKAELPKLIFHLSQGGVSVKASITGILGNI